MAEACIIIGGGVAGLSAAVRLAELGFSPLLLEAGKYPSHRICGEFLSPECLPVMERWGLAPPVRISNCRFCFNNRDIEFALPQVAAGFSRYDFDQKLLDLARKKGAQVLTEAVVEDFAHREFYEVLLSNGEKFQTKQLIIGTGRLPQLFEKQKPSYTGFKAHFEGIDLSRTLEMHCFKGGYIGLSPVAPGVVNVAGLARLDLPHNPDILIKSLPKLERRFQNAHILFEKWLTGQVPEFGIRKTPSWPNVFWIGDAAGSIPPVCGDGLGIALTTGIMAAEYAVNKSEISFKRDWLKRYRRRFFWGQWLHRIVMQPTLSSLGTRCCALFPSLPSQIFALTRE